MAEGHPHVVITEEGPREGMQIERPEISIDDKVALIEALADAGLRRIVVGSFVSPKWTPQMAGIDELVSRLRPRTDVAYLAVALNDRGVERRRTHVPPLTVDEDVPETHGHLCDIFIVRNTNRTLTENQASWAAKVASAVAAGATEAGIGLSAAWGSNWRGRFELADRMENLAKQHDLWDEAGIPVTTVKFADPMGWVTPNAVTDTVAEIRARWPSIHRFNFHLHNQRGLAMVSFYAALLALDADHTLMVDSTIGGIGGCPFCGNGRAAGMIPTEDLVQLLEELGIETGVDIYRLVEASHLASRIIGRPLDGHVSAAGPLPYGDRLYPETVPAIETHEQAQHFRLGPNVYAGQPSPWRDRTSAG
jgi:hydroxymethylglutaryl-CoA lyase